MAARDAHAGAPSAAPSAGPAAAQADADAEARAPSPAGEAERAEIARLDADPLLATHAGVVKKHFGAAAGPFLVQRVGTAGGRSFTLVSSRDESDPLLLAGDGTRLLWTKERPTAGMIAPAVNLAIAARAPGGALLFAYDVPTRAVAARVWEEDGAAFADFQIMTLDACDDLSAARWPGRGWIVVCAWLGGARAQLLREDGTLAWRRGGADVGAPWRAPAPVSIAFDGERAVVLVQYGDAPAGGGGAAEDFVVATRYDARGRPTWASPVTLGATPRIVRTRDRVPIAPAGGAVRVTLGRGKTVDLDASGRRP